MVWSNASCTAVGAAWAREPSLSPAGPIGGAQRAALPRSPSRTRSLTLSGSAESVWPGGRLQTSGWVPSGWCAVPAPSSRRAGAAYGCRWGVDDRGRLVGIALAVVSVYAALALEMEGATSRTVLPLGRRGAGERAVRAALADQLEDVGTESGVRQQL
jgi:hypothetical protein